MKKLVLMFIALSLALPVAATNDEPKDSPIRHLQVEDFTSMEEAKKTLIQKTSEIKSKKKLDQLELQEIHVLTYTIEKSIAYLAERLEGERQELAKEIAVVVEDIHISSENSRQEETEQHLSKYLDLTETFFSGFQ